MIAVGIDNAELTGFAVVEDGPAGLVLLHHGTATICTGADVERVMAEIAIAGVQVIAIEQPFVKTAARGGNPHSALELATLVGRWLQACDARGIPAITALASTWQPVILKCDRWAPRAMRKAAAVHWVRNTFGVTVSEDEADAIAIAAWALRHQQPARLERKHAPLLSNLMLPGMTP